MCFAVTCWERADLLALVCGVFCEFVTFPLVSWVRCGTWLYRFLIFATLLTLQMTSKFKLDLYLIMLYPSVKFERNCCIPLKVIDRKPQIHNLAKIYVKKGHISFKKLRITLFFRTWPAFNDAWPFCKAYMNLMHPFKSYRSKNNSVTPQTTMTPTMTTPLQKHDLYVSSLHHRQHNKGLCKTHDPEAGLLRAVPFLDPGA